VAELKDRDCGFVSLGDCDTTNEMGRFMLTVMSGIAELERDLIRKRCQAGIERAKAEARNSAGHQPSTRVKGARLPSVTPRARQWLSWPASTSAAMQRSGGRCMPALSQKASVREACC
jgi:DNA invertase Pin-like site-specific DNA recombinase